MSKTEISNPIIPLNYKAVEYLGWFMSDAQNLRNWAIQLFNSDIDMENPQMLEIKAAAESALSEIEDDVASIKEFLVGYVPANSKINK